MLRLCWQTIVHKYLSSVGMSESRQAWSLKNRKLACMHGFWRRENWHANMVSEEEKIGMQAWSLIKRKLVSWHGLTEEKVTIHAWSHWRESYHPGMISQEEKIIIEAWSHRKRKLSSRHGLTEEKVSIQIGSHRKKNFTLILEESKKVGIAMQMSVAANVLGHSQCRSVLYVEYIMNLALQGIYKWMCPSIGACPRAHLVKDQGACSTLLRINVVLWVRSCGVVYSDGGGTSGTWPIDLPTLPPSWDKLL